MAQYGIPRNAVLNRSNNTFTRYRREGERRDTKVERVSRRCLLPLPVSHLLSEE
jgi:hypothetical protein